MPREIDSEEKRNAYEARERYELMFGDGEPPFTPSAVKRQIARDRQDHAPTYAPGLTDPDAETIASRMLCLRFIVEVCGVTYEAAEAELIDALRARLDGHYIFEPAETATTELVAADLVRRLGAVEALFEARLVNEAAKGTPWASFYNEVVRLLRTRRFAPLDTGAANWSAPPLQSDD